MYCVSRYSWTIVTSAYRLPRMRTQMFSSGQTAALDASSGGGGFASAGHVPRSASHEDIIADDVHLAPLSVRPDVAAGTGGPADGSVLDTPVRAGVVAGTLLLAAAVVGATAAAAFSGARRGRGCFGPGARPRVLLH